MPSWNGNGSRGQRVFAKPWIKVEGGRGAAPVAFARRGFRVILTARRTEQREHLADELRNGFPGCEAHPIQADVSRPEDIRRAVTSGLERFGKIDILFANAGSVALGARRA